MTLEPLRSAMTIENVEDTSLALPSDNKLRTGQQRVIDQVHTIKRSKSKHSKSGTPSPIGPLSDSVSTEVRKFQFSPTKLNGTVFSRSNSVAVAGFTKMVGQQQSRTLSTKSLGRRHMSSSSQWEQRYGPLSPTNGFPPPQPGGLKPSRSDPSLAPAQLVQRAKSRSTTLQTRSNRASLYTVNSGQYVVNGSASFASSQNRVLRPPSNISNGETKVSATKSRSEFVGTNGAGSIPDITMKEAVEFLSSQQESYQLKGASFIQHSTFNEEKAKQEVLQLGGIPPLVALLSNPNTQIQQTAAAALRNLVFKAPANKQEVQQCGGIAEALALLRETGSSETQKQLTGLLWNLSSADSLKSDLIDSALPVLTESIVIPFTCWSDQSISNNVDPEVFYNATGCLRNLSSSKEPQRQSMRNCRGLIDSLISYIQSCVAADRPDDKSVENCMCILHNLTYQVEFEAPDHFAQINALAETPTRSSASKKSPPVGCFSPKSSKIQQENVFNFPLIEDSNPKGLSWLFHSKTIQIYLSLLGSSLKDSTLEACAGALQNLTANKGVVSSVMSQTIVQKLNGLPEIVPLLQSSSPGVQKAAVSVVGNLARTPNLQSTMARQVLPHLTSLLSSGAKNMDDYDDTMATACNTVHSLLKADPEMGRKVLNNSLVTMLSDLSNNGYGKYPKASRAASLLLYGLWAEKDMQGFLKKQGMNKSVFVNDFTTSAYKAARFIE
ncbi:plakophilin-1 [Megalops cyprinoides]|uniref:plakophilin-1 n=1 Tax=Megalops cyprinoides TaxID=118141 RepID=UPI001864607A|nr:plakophilin-1 [Megalops cyprinoides]